MGLWDFEDFRRSFAKSGKIKKENVGPFFEKEHRSKFPFVCFSNAESKNEKNDILDGVLFQISVQKVKEWDFEDLRVPKFFRKSGNIG